MIEEGTILQDRYHVERQIGAGGMGTVYVGTDQRFGSTVAIKETFFSDENLTKAFEREARLLNSLRHPALPRVSDHFIDGNGQFIVMEYIPGEDLSEMMASQGKAFSVAEVMTWADQLLDALDYLHTQEMPVVHRDIKPQNLKLTARGQIILLDFGLAKGNPTDSNHQTNTKSVFGFSRVYAPLEQIQGTGTDPRSDIYSLAATIYHLMTGVPPEDALTRATAVLNGNPDPLKRPDSLRPEVSSAVADVLMNSMALNANFRPSSAAAMRAVLDDARNNISPGLAEMPTVVTTNVPAAASSASSAGAIFDQKTQVIGGENTATAPVGFVAPTEQQSKHSGGFDVQIPATEEMTQVSGRTGKKRSRGWLALGAAAAAVLLAVGCSAAIYIYNPDLFKGAWANTENPVATENNAEDKKEGSTEAPSNISGEAAEAQTALKSEEAKEKTPEAAEAAGVTKEQKARNTKPGSDDAGDEDDDPEISAGANAGDTTVGTDNKLDAEERELQKAIKAMVQKRMKQANVQDRRAQQQIDEAFRDGPPPGNGAYRPRNPNFPPPQPRKKIIIRKP